MWNKKEMNWLDAVLTRVPLTLTFDLDLWPWIFKVKLYLRSGRPECHGMKGTGVDGMPWCKIIRKWVNWMLHWLGYLWPWPLTFKVKLYYGNGRPHCCGTKGTGVDRMSWCETLRKWVNWMLHWLGYLWPWLWPSRSNCISRMGGLIAMERKGQETIGWPDVKHSHYLTSRQRILLGTGVT